MVVKQKLNGKWEYCIYLGIDELGKKKYKRKSGFKTKNECIQASKKIKGNEKNKTFNDICQLYLKDCINRHLKKTTIISYKSNIQFFKINFKKYNVDIKKINVDDINEFILHSSTITHKDFTRSIISVLKTICTFAKNKNYIKNNIFDNIKLPPLYHNHRKIWSESDLKKYFPILEKFKYFDMIMLALETGLRKGEPRALTWDCIDLENGIITIDKSYIMHGNVKVINPPKTKSAIRDILLLERSIKILRKKKFK